MHLLCSNNGLVLFFLLLASMIGPLILICDIQFGPFVPIDDLSVGGHMYGVVFGVVLGLGAVSLSLLLSFGVGQFVCMVASRIGVA